MPAVDQPVPMKKSRRNSPDGVPVICVDQDRPPGHHASVDTIDDLTQVFVSTRTFGHGSLCAKNYCASRAGNKPVSLCTSNTQRERHLIALKHAHEHLQQAAGVRSTKTINQRPSFPC